MPSKVHHYSKSEREKQGSENTGPPFKYFSKFIITHSVKLQTRD